MRHGKNKLVFLILSLFLMMLTTGYSVGTQVTNYNFIIFHYYF